MVMETKQPFEAVVRDHGLTVLRVCRVVLGVHDADDAWSETFLAAMRAYPALDVGANVEAWLVTIAHRKALDVVRASARRAEPSERVSGESTLMDSSALENQELWDAVRVLPTKQRLAVAYHYVAGLAYVDVADILGGTADAARRAAADGIKSLRSTLLNTTVKGVLT
jgi:RNA polymerase sigma factor (sigma-70 family)